MFQHKVVIGFNPTQIARALDKALPVQGVNVTKIPSRAAELVDEGIEPLRQQLRDSVKDLCKTVGETSLPPLRAINYETPLIDADKVYQWHPSRCPEAFKALWLAKRNEYIKGGRWRVATGSNLVPLLIIKKPGSTKDEPKIQTFVDRRQQNDNTKKVASPLPDQENILRNVAAHRFRSIMNGKEAYEQIRVKPEHFTRTLFKTPDGTLVSEVMQHCNAGATYQSLMHHLFVPYIGVFMDIYLDNIVIYSDTIEDHMKHVKTVLCVARSYTSARIRRSSSVSQCASSAVSYLTEAFSSIPIRSIRSRRGRRLRRKSC